MSEFRPSPELESLEIELLLDALFRHYGYDFRNYAPASLRRRIWNFIRAQKLATISGLQERLLHEPDCMDKFVLGLSVNVTEMFRDPGFYLTFRQKVIPLLRTYPSIQIWHAGCSSGEEVYSMAILLQEEGLYQRCRLYATDINQEVLEQAKQGIFPLKNMQTYTTNYLKAGGKRSFSEYYTAGYDNAILRPSLRENMLFALHNLVTDGVFNEFHVIICRNVTIYFNKVLQGQVHQLIYDSLISLGILGLGTKESLRFIPQEEHYTEIEPGSRIYRKNS